jgi:hypothetical protein
LEIKLVPTKRDNSSKKFIALCKKRDSDQWMILKDSITTQPWKAQEFKDMQELENYFEAVLLHNSFMYMPLTTEALSKFLNKYEGAKTFTITLEETGICGQ